MSERIRAALKQHGMTQAQFANLTGITDAHMSTIIRYDRDVRLSTYHKIDRALTTLEQSK